MPVNVTIRNVPDKVRNELAARAARSGRSLQEYLRAQLIELAGKPTVEEVLEGARKRLTITKSRLTREEILRYIREDRR